jgi:WD40 repeat protein
MYERKSILSSVAVSNDGTMLAIGCWCDTTQLYDTRSSRNLIAELMVKKKEGYVDSGVACLAFTSDNTSLVIGEYGNVEVWSIGSLPPSLRHSFPGHLGWIFSIAVFFQPCHHKSADGDVGDIDNDHSGCVGHNRVASGGRDGTIRIWDINDGTCASVIHGHNGAVNALACNADGTHLASGGNDRTVCIWDTITSTPIARITGNASTVLSLAYSPDGRMLARGGNDKAICIYETQNYVLQNTLIGHSGPINSMSFTPDGSLIISASDDKTIRGWDTKNMAQLHVWKGHTDCVISVAVSPDGSSFVSGSKDKSVREWVLYRRPSAGNIICL